MRISSNCWRNALNLFMKNKICRPVQITVLFSEWWERRGKMKLLKKSYSVEKQKQQEKGIMNWKQSMDFMVVSVSTIMEDKHLVMNKNIRSLFLHRMKFQFNTLAPFSATLPISLPNQTSCTQLTEKLPIQGEPYSHGRLFLCSHVSQWFPFNQNHLPKEIK